MRRVRWPVLMLVLSAAWLGTASAAADLTQGSTGTRHSGPAAVVQRGVSRLLGFLGTKERAGPQESTAFLKTEVAPLFDFAYMAHWVAGGHRDTMSREQMQALAQRIEHTLIRALGRGLTRFEHRGIRVLRGRRVSPEEAWVDVVVSYPQGYHSKIRFRLYPGPNGWKIFDVGTHGASLLAWHRMAFMRAYSPAPAEAFREP